MEPSRYQPIACDFHDQLESFATLKRRVRLGLKDEDASLEGRIEDIWTAAGQEFLRLDNGAEIRLDRIADVTPLA